jgi:hypothetical protein
MMKVYNEELYLNHDDRGLRQVVAQVRDSLEQGPDNIGGAGANDGRNANPFTVSRRNKRSHQWSEELKSLKEHFSLELKVVDLLMKCKEAALKQDHITTILTMNQLKECYGERHTKFYERTALKDLHN